MAVRVRAVRSHHHVRHQKDRTRHPRNQRVDLDVARLDLARLRPRLVAGRDLPIWSEPDGEESKVAFTSGAAAYEKGLTVRPTRETARDTVRWWKTLPAERTPE